MSQRVYKRLSSAQYILVFSPGDQTLASMSMRKLYEESSFCHSGLIKARNPKSEEEWNLEWNVNKNESKNVCVFWEKVTLKMCVVGEKNKKRKQKWWRVKGNEESDLTVIFLSSSLCFFHHLLRWQCKEISLRRRKSSREMKKNQTVLTLISPLIPACSSTARIFLWISLYSFSWEGRRHSFENRII
jgi:hypothetical protein